MKQIANILIYCVFFVQSYIIVLKSSSWSMFNQQHYLWVCFHVFEFFFLIYNISLHTNSTIRINLTWWYAGDTTHLCVPSLRTTSSVFHVVIWSFKHCSCGFCKFLSVFALLEGKEQLQLKYFMCTLLTSLFLTFDIYLSSCFLFLICLAWNAIKIWRRCFNSVCWKYMLHVY